MSHIWMSHVAHISFQISPRMSHEHTATHCNTRQHTATHKARALAYRISHEHTATHCSTENEPWAHCNTLQHTINTENEPWAPGDTQGSFSGLLSEPWAHCNSLQQSLQHRKRAMSTPHHWAHSLSKPENEPCLTWMSHCHITYTNASSHTYESTRHITHMKLSCIHMCFICVSWGIRICDNSHIYGSCMWDMAHSRAYWVSAWRVTHMNMSYYTYECVILRRGGLG